MIDERIVRSGDADLFVRSAGGDGESPEVFIGLHGGPGASHDEMADLFQLASPELQVVLYDQRGSGRSTGTVGADILDRQVDDLLAVLDSTGAGRAHLLGHSAGCYWIVLASRRKPDVIASAIFVDSAPASSEIDARAGRRFQVRLKALVAGNVITPAPEGSDDSTWLKSILPVFYYNPRLAAAHRKMDISFNREVNQVAEDALGDYDFTADLEAFDVPCLCFVSPVPFGSEMAGSVASALPDEVTTTIELTQCGHFPWLESPGRFYPPVREFLKRVTAGDEQEPSP